MENLDITVGKLKGIGPKSEKCLNEIGIFTKTDLQKTGPVQAFLQLKEQSFMQPSLNFLYAMVGALEDKHWADIAKSEKTRLLMELEGYQALRSLLSDEKND
ncbi:TfoX/Sxy family protein [Kaarinaea lacus]